MNSFPEIPSVASLKNISIEDISSLNISVNDLPPSKEEYGPASPRKQRSREERLSQFSHSKHLYSIQSQYIFQDYAPKVFDRIRTLSGISRKDYLEELAPDMFLGNLNNQKFSEGRSGAFFCFSPNKNFILKTITKSEAKLLQSLLPTYYPVCVVVKVT